MNRILTQLTKGILTTLLTFCCSFFAQAQLLTEDFSFTGNLTASGWSAHSSATLLPIATTPTGLTYAGHSGSGVGQAASVLGLSSAEDVNRSFANQAGNGTVLYYSCLVNITDAANKSGEYFIHLSTATFSGRAFIRTTALGVNFAINNSSGTPVYGSTNFPRNTTLFVVVKYTINTSGADATSIWAYSSGMPTTEAAAGTPESSTIASTGADAIAQIALRQGGGNQPNAVVDAIRVGTTWASVMPIANPAPTATTTAATAISTTGATLNGSVNANGTSTNVTFEYGTSVTYGTTAAGIPSPVTGTTATNVSLVIPAVTLAVNTQYNFRVVGASTGGTTNGSNLTFFTLAATPGTPTVGSPTSGSLNVALAADLNPAGTQYAIQETSTSNYVQVNGTLAGAEVWRTAAEWTSSIVVGSLASFTSYTFQVKARNGANVQTAFSATASGMTLVNTDPLITITGTLSPFQTAAGTPSFSKNYSVSAVFLTNNLVITAPALFQLSTDTSVSWNSSLSISPSSGTIGSTIIYVRFNPIAAGTSSGSITHVAALANNPSVSVSGTAIDVEPSAQSVVTTSNVTNNSMLVQMAGGTGSSRIVVASTSPVTYVPVDGFPPTGVNSNYGLAIDQSGNRVVYNGTGTSFSLTGLSQTTQYYLASFEYNGSGVTKNYINTNPGTANATTYLNPPTTASTLSVRMKLDTLNLVFTGGNGARRLVVVSEGAGVTLTPTFGQTFTGVNSDFSLATNQGSNNRIVFDGTGSAVTVTGIQRNTLYGIKVIEYNGTGAATSYFITSGATTTLTTADFQPYITGTTYTQNFNTLPISGTFTTTGFGVGPYWLIGPLVNAPATRGWQFAKNGGSVADVLFSVDNGSSGSGSIFSYGSTSSTDRSLGFLSSGSFVGTGGITFVNNSAVPLYSASVSFNGEQWRIQSSVDPNQLKLQYSLGSTSILGGTWIDIPALTYSNPLTGTTAAVDGNANAIAINGTFTIPANWMPGQSLTLRILDVEDSGTDHGLAIDDFTFSAVPAAAPLDQDNTITFSSVLTTSMNVNWVNGDGESRIVIMNTSNSFTNPTDGVNPTANSVYAGSGEQVIYNGTGSSVNVTGLLAETTYHVRVYAYNSSGAAQKYATQTATGNPASQLTAAASPPTMLSVSSVNGGNAVLVNTPFSITVQSVDALSNPQNVNAATTVTMSVLSGAGTGALTGTLSGVIAAGANTVTITGLLYDVAEFGVQLLADATSGITTLSDATTPAINVFAVANAIDFELPPVYAVVGTSAQAINVKAYRADLSVDDYYIANVTLSKVSGPGTLSGTLTKAAIAGQASFTDIQFSAPGTYVLTATSGSFTTAPNMTILVTLPPVMNELAIPQYFGSKSSATANTNRTPVISCISFDNLLPSTTYSLAAGLALTSEASTVLGAGTVWNTGSFSGQIINNLFTTNPAGSSGVLWMAIQPSGSSTRFAPGQAHKLRVALSTIPFVAGPITAQYSSAATLTALDIPTTAYDADASNDGAFVTATSDSCFSGRFALAYGNDTGSGQPLSISTIVNGFYVNGTQSTLPGSVDSVYNNTAVKGSYAFVIPAASVSTNGVRYIGIRNSTNQLLNSISDADGIWGSGANTTNLTRRQVVRLSNSEASMTTLTSLAITATTNVSCFGFADGAAQALATSLTPTINYTWTPSGGNAAQASNLAAGNYTVVASDVNGCFRSAIANITQPALFPITVTNDGPGCIGNNVQLSATGGVSYSWTGQGGYASAIQNPVLTALTIANSGVYTVVITDATGCTQTGSTFVSVLNCNCTPPVLSNTITNACNNTATGSIDLTVSGGVAPYSFLWSTGATTEDISGLAPGTYQVTVTDDVVCIAQQSFTVGNIAIPVITPSGPTTLCTGGSVDLTASSGNTYLWSNGETTQTISASTAGSYSVTVTTGSCVLTSAATTIVVNAFGFAGNLYAENMGSVGGTTQIATYTGWQNAQPITYTSTSSLPVDVRVTNASNNSGSSGLGNIFFAASTLNPDRNLIISGINTLGYTGLSLNFGMRREASGTDQFSVEFSSNGTTWTPMTMTTPTGTSWTLITPSGSLPATANLRLRFSKNSTSNAFRIDDIKISGTTTAATIGNNAPLAVCGSGSVYLSANTATGILWSTGATTKSILVNTTGTYTYTATGANGCTSTSAPVTFTVNPEPVASATAGTILCNGGTTTVTVSGSNGVGPYSGTGDFVVTAGVYNYIVTDVTGCDDTTAITVNQPPVLNGIATPGVIACSGGTTSVVVTASGGTGPYTGTGTFTNVSAGAYSYTVTDNNGCTAVASGTISQPAVLAATAAPGVIACNGGTTTVIVSATGGTLPYSGTGSNIVFAGAYSYTVTDAAGCTSVVSGNITQPSAVVVTASPGTILCIGGSTNVVVTASGGVGPYSGEGTFTASAGAYSYTVTDANGCAGTATGTILQPTLLLANATAGTIECNGGTTTITVTASGGTAPYNDEGTFTASAGPYSYTVTDANGCTAVASGTIIEPALLTLGSFTPSSGIAGTSVTISGTGFTGTTQVLFGELPGLTSFVVTEETKDASHPYFGLGSTHGYVIDGVQGPELTMVRGTTYSFVISAPGHPVVITTSPVGGGANSGSIITNGVVNGSTTNGTMTFTPDATTPDLVYYNCGVHAYMGYKINILNTPVVATFTVNSSTSISATVPAGAVTGPITVLSPCGTVTTATDFVVLPSTVTLNLRVLLQGFYMSGGQMTSALLNQGVIGASALESDSITVELRSATSPFATAYTKTGILDLDGDGTFVFPAGASGNSYYIVVLHRNHLQTWSKNPVTFSTVTGYDFTVASAPRPAGQPGGVAPSAGSTNKQ